MRLSSGALGPLFVLAASCNFDAAFQRYCEGNPSCPRADAGAGPETAPDTAPDAPPDATSAPDTSLGPPDSGVGRDLLGDGLPPLPPLPPKICRQDNDCRANEICHPLGNVCMKTCNTVDDCPLYLDTCAEITEPNGGPISTRKVCKCTITENCSNFATNFTCNSLDNLCEPSCGSNQECSWFQPARSCDVPSGQCLYTCSSNRDCPVPTQPRCDPSTSRCAGCLSDADCSSRPDGLPRCDSSGACVRP